MRESIETVVVGGGQAGLVMSHCLRERGLEHVVLERSRVAERWRTDRWDSLRFQFPNWTLRLPGFAYQGPDPHAFATRDDVSTFIVDYARHIDAPLRCGVSVTRVAASPRGGFLVEHPGGTLEARNVVIATGPFQAGRLPPATGNVSSRVLQLHSNDYRNPGQLPPGGVLVVGSGSSGCQIAEELVASGRRTYLSVSQHRRAPRRYRGLDLVAWLHALGRFDALIDAQPDRKVPIPLVLTGADGGHDVDLRALAALGVQLLGRLQAIDGNACTFADDLEAHLRFADDSFREFVAQADAHADALGLPADGAQDPGNPPPLRSARHLDLVAENVAAIVWCTGFRFDLGWVDLPILDASGAPKQRRGVTSVPGACFLGLHWMHSMKSGVLFGVHDDAAYLAGHLASRG